MRDSEIVALLAAGERQGLEAAYTAYADRIYDYAHSMLRQADGTAAADVTHDTFLIALAKASGLRDPERFRSWLYAIARNECLRVLRQSKRTAPLPDTDEHSRTSPDQGSADMATDLSRSELGELVHAAAAGLSPKDREVFDLGMRHDLQAVEMAKALGVSENAAHAMLSRVRGQFKRSLGALTVARNGRRTCAVLDGLLSGWDGSFAPLWRKRIARHVEGCKSCSQVQGRELSPAALLSLAPLLGAPALVRERLFGPDLDLVSADTSAPIDTTTALVGVGHRLAERAGPFAPDGFPGEAGGARRRAAALVLAAAMLLVVSGGWWITRGDAAPEQHDVAAPAVSTLSTSHAPYNLQPGQTLSASTSASKSPSASASPSAGETPSIPGTTPTGPPATSGPSNGPSNTATSSSSSPSGVPSSVLTSSSSSGTLAVTPTSMTVSRGSTGTVRLTAQGGTVDWSGVREGAAATYTSLSQYSGTLAGGASTSVTISVSAATPRSVTQLVVVFGPGARRVVITIA